MRGGCGGRVYRRPEVEGSDGPHGGGQRRRLGMGKRIALWSGVVKSLAMSWKVCVVTNFSSAYHGCG